MLKSLKQIKIVDYLFDVDLLIILLNVLVLFCWQRSSFLMVYVYVHM